MNRLRLQNESGFTLIELLVVVAIIGILAAIAIPQFAAYRKRGHEAQVKSDLRNAAVAQEAYFAQNSTYTSAGAITDPTAPGFNPTTQVTINAARGTNTFTDDRHARQLQPAYHGRLAARMVRSLVLLAVVHNTANTSTSILRIEKGGHIAAPFFYHLNRFYQLTETFLSHLARSQQVLENPKSISKKAEFSLLLP